MVQVSLHCPFCGSDNIGKNGHSNGKQRYLYRNIQCPHRTFYAEYTYNDCKRNTQVVVGFQFVVVLLGDFLFFYHSALTKFWHFSARVLAIAEMSGEPLSKQFDFSGDVKRCSITLPSASAPT